ncbi:MAG: pseudouridine synthase [Candidatus Aminicenantaceae bacterium]
MIRINKYLSAAGVSSRREADRLIEQGRVKVNGKIVQTLGSKIDENKDRIEVDGKIVEGTQGKIYILLNKPPEFLVTLKDPFQRPTIMDFLPKLKTRIFPVGRLDFDSEGLLLMTNDGELTNRLIHPRYEIKKNYLVKIQGHPEKVQISRLEKGIPIDGKKTAPAKISPISSSPKRSLFKVELHEGRKREIRRMFEAIGYHVLLLRRIKFAGLTLDGLNPGDWRYLTDIEVQNLYKKVGLKR